MKESDIDSADAATSLEAHSRREFLGRLGRAVPAVLATRCGSGRPRHAGGAVREIRMLRLTRRELETVSRQLSTLPVRGVGGNW